MCSSPARLAVSPCAALRLGPVRLARGGRGCLPIAGSRGGRLLHARADRLERGRTRQFTTSITVNVSGYLKLGNLDLSFTDLTVPVAGIPITITRTYNSLELRYRRATSATAGR